MSLSTESQHRVRILHISDLHERGSREREIWRRRRVLGDAWDRNLAEILQDGPIDLVCFTGDAADWGLPEEYEAATDFFHALIERLSLSKERLFVVPGNHDVARRHEEVAWKSFREALDRGPDRLAISRWMAGGETPSGFDTSWRDQILVRQQAYRQWVHEQLQRRDLEPSERCHPRLGYRAALDLPGLTHRIHILGLDTAWLCGGDSDDGRLWITEDQLMRLATTPEGRPLTGLRLLLMHHPLHMLVDGAHCRRLLADHVDLVLRGHLHEPELELWADPDRQVRQLAAGSLYEGGQADHWPHACNTVTVELDPLGRLVNASVRFRVWSARGGHWHDDDSLYKESRQGRVTWSVQRSVVSHAVANPYDPWTTPIPDRCFGRIALFSRLDAALELRRSVSLVGDWRIGKSSVLQVWYERVQKRGREVRLLTGEGPEGVSPGAFVGAIVGTKTPDDVDSAANVLSGWAERIGKLESPPLVIVDEFDGFLPRFENRFFERLRGMLGRICLLLSSRRELDRLYQELGRTSPFHNRLELEWVGLLEPDAADRLTLIGNDALGLRELQMIREWAGRHPFYIQLVGHHLVDSVRRGEGVTTATDRFQTEAAARFRELWRVLDERDQDALRKTVAGIPAQRRSLRLRGLVTEEGWPFGRIFTEWLREEI